MTRPPTRPIVLAALTTVWMAVSAWHSTEAAGDTQVAAASSFASQQIVSTYCITCHNDKLKTGGLVLDRPELADVAAHADVWEKVIRKVRTGMMPPAGSPRPNSGERDALLASLVSTLDAAARVTPNPGRPLVHRMNRAEYANAIRDLLALDIDAAALLPPDDSSAGFDNNADVLGVSPVLLESYLTAAAKISAIAVGSPAIAAGSETYRI